MSYLSDAGSLLVVTAAVVLSVFVVCGECICTWFMGWRMGKSGKDIEGDLTNPANQGEDISADKNTSVCLSNLPANCRACDILKELRNVGKIWSFSLIPPEELFTTAAAKVVFWDRDGLEAFLKKYRRDKFTVLGTRPRVCMTRCRISSEPPSDASRAMVITGPSEIIRMSRLCDLFEADLDSDFDYDLERMMKASNEDTGQSSIEVRFTSFKDQAEAAWRIVNKAIAGDDLPGTVLSPHESDLWRTTTQTSTMGDASIESPEWRKVEVGRIVLLQGTSQYAGRLAAIVEIIDHKRALVDGPASDPKLAVPRQAISFSDCLLADMKIEKLPRAVRTGTLKALWEKAGIDEKWKESNWAKRKLQGERRKALTDFERFKVMRLKKQRRFEERKALAKVKASA
ncbi:Uu.00g112360.m01.CDS01 [Anthostomella pinea]|uniref:Uu.00g112360.m01.CDS01 n=1 Tax=Anthostomella pinea TaxID=933095 RepID=A0AAI8YGK8_9PEZI|nr:Uu.00g112360.m01.CDS01 [Anthostomella pinea]